ncbi:MAG TPA: type I DNA topoisomerase, partial [Anaerolineae bacterium]|nr:type I DNA topoisomerase [Anaerolineae bacterium]
MEKSLVIVESPVKAKTINKFLGDSYIVKPTGGHIIDLPKDEFGIDIENGFVPTYTVIKGKDKTLQELKKTAEKADTIFLATDPDREGEAIAWHVAHRIVKENQPSYRVLINQITRDTVLNAINNKGELDLNKVYAQQARRVLDRLVGYKVSPILSEAIIGDRYSGLSAGRVQSVALRLIVERDSEIKAFVPEEYWIIKVLLLTEKGEVFEAKLGKKNGKKLKISTSEEAETVVKELSSLIFHVKDIIKKKTKRQPSPPFITSTLQQESSRRLGFPISKTMRLAQSLYEGIELEDGSAGLITYMRTDSTRIASEAINEARSYITKKWGKDHVPEKPNLYKSRKGAQDAHEAIRPASLSRPPDKVKSFLSSDQLKLYTLIWNRFVASQMKPAEYTVVTVDITAGTYELMSSSTHLDYQGFLLAYQDVKQEEGDEESPVSELPPLVKGDKLKLKETIPSQNFTKPPSHYTEATLVKELESLGIGRPSTYAQIINTIQTRKYVHREKGKLKATDLGMSVNKILVSNFPDLFSTAFTANMEEELDKVETGEYEWRQVVGEFYGPFNESLEQLKLKRGELKKSLIEETDKVCEKCGKPMVIRWGRNGRFMACSGFPACRNTSPLGTEISKTSEDESQIEETGEICEKCGKPMVIRSGRKGRFMACSGFPSCKNTRPLAEEKPET